MPYPLLYLALFGALNACNRAPPPATSARPASHVAALGGADGCVVFAMAPDPDHIQTTEVWAAGSKGGFQRADSLLQGYFAHLWADGAGHVWLVTRLSSAGTLVWLHRSTDGGKSWDSGQYVRDALESDACCISVDANALVVSSPGSAVLDIDAVGFDAPIRGFLTRDGVAGTWSWSSDGPAAGLPSSWDESACPVRTGADAFVVESAFGRLEIPRADGS